MAEAITIEGRLELTDSTPPYHIVKFPKERLASFEFKRGLRRVVCSINGDKPYQCAVFPSKDSYFVTVNKQTRDRLHLAEGDAVTLTLTRDESKYGTPVPKEFAVVLKQDPAAEGLFLNLSPGNQRIFLKLVDLGRDIDTRIARSLAGLELLKFLNGKFDYNATNQAMRMAGKIAASKR